MQFTSKNNNFITVTPPVTTAQTSSLARTPRAARLWTGAVLAWGSRRIVPTARSLISQWFRATLTTSKHITTYWRLQTRTYRSFSTESIRPTSRCARRRAVTWTSHRNTITFKQLTARAALESWTNRRAGVASSWTFGMIISRWRSSSRFTMMSCLVLATIITDRVLFPRNSSVDTRIRMRLWRRSRITFSRIGEKNLWEIIYLPNNSFTSYHRRVRTLYACLAENEGELSFEPNQIIINGEELQVFAQAQWN